MKRRFAILTAAIALLTILAIPMGMYGQTTVTQTSFTGISGNVNNDTKVSFAAYKGGGTSNPAANSGAIRLYQNSNSETGGYVVIGVTSGYQITSATIQSTMATTTGYKLTDTDPGSTTPAKNTFNVSNHSLAANTDYTVDNIASQYIVFACFGNSSSSRLYLSKISVTYESTGSQTTTYTVTYHANVTGVSDIEVEYNEGATVTIADNTFSNPGYVFTEWNTEADGSGDSYAPGNEIEDIDDNLEFYAQWEESDEITATLTQSNLELTGSYTTDTEKTIDGITYVYTDLMKSSSNIQAKATTGTVKNSTPYPGDIISVVITHSGTARATAINGSMDGTNWTQVATGSGSITADFSGRGYKYFQITRGSNAAYWEKIDITYSANASTQSQSDLAITNASTDLTFDLYNNSTAQVINYTTSSTGAITITPASPTSYFSYVHDATAKTITVTPLAVTPSAQTVTMSQEADENYYPGTTTFTVSVVNSDPNVPGTQNNPYTVAQARAAIDANTGITNVYATGIISQVDSYSNNTITYWISDDGTTTNQLEVYKGKNLNNTNFTALSDVEVGATVIVYGTLTKYNNTTYEFTSGNYLTSYTAPVHAVEAPTFSPVAGTYAEAQSVTISCATTPADIYYTTDGSDPDANSTLYDGTALTISSTTTIKAIAYSGGANSNITTATYHINSQANPYTVAQALAFNEYPANGIYVTGIVSTAPTSLSSGTLTYYISVDGEDSNELEVYKGKGLNNESFTSKDDIQVGDIVTVYGNVVEYTSGGTTILEFASGNYLVSFERPAQQYNLTVTPSANVEIYTFVGDDPTQEGQAGAFTTQVYDDTTVGISVSADEGYILSLIVDGTDVTSQLDETGWYEFTMPAHDVTVTATASLAPVATSNTYTLATSIESGKQYIIVGQADGDYYAMGNDKGNNRYAYGITLDGTTATADIADTGVHEFTITTITEGYYSIMDATTSGGYLYAAGSGSGKNYLKTESVLDENDNGKWAITFATDGTVAVIAQGTSTNNQMRFNNNNILFSCYSSGQHPVYLYVKDETPIIETGTYTLDIEGYGDDNTVTTGWHLIASPTVEDVTPSAENGFLANTYDLYSFDQTGGDNGKEWKNYKNEEFNIVNGKGYLYANSTTTTLSFTGTPYNGTGEVPLTIGENATDQPMGKWNLVGNPFNETAYIDHDYYRMDADGELIVEAETGAGINRCEGIFVIADEDGETLTFSTTAPSKASSKLVMNLSNNRGNAIDRAIVRFGEGRQLPKFQLRENSTKLYIPQEGNDYAVVRSEGMGDIPVNFKAENNGTYTLTFNNEEVGFEYLHLIDNKTGNNVDLKANPSYTFEANVADYASRFRLVFSANSVNEQVENEEFAFFNGSEWVIYNNGVANLQVIDMSGRVISTETVNGNATTKVNAATGVYMLRLTNGNNVKTQKVLVK